MMLQSSGPHVCMGWVRSLSKGPSSKNNWPAPLWLSGCNGHWEHHFLLLPCFSLLFYLFFFLTTMYLSISDIYLGTSFFCVANVSDIMFLISNFTYLLLLYKQVRLSVYEPCILHSCVIIPFHDVLYFLCVCFAVVLFFVWAIISSIYKDHSYFFLPSLCACNFISCLTA